MPKPLNWHDYYFELAKTVAKRSSCLRNQVGAVIVDPETKRVLSTGYNGTPTGVQSCYDRGVCFRIENNIESGTRYETCRSVHAEQNAIIQLGLQPDRQAEMYIFGHNQVCKLCKRFILQAHIRKIWLKLNDTSETMMLSTARWKFEL